MTVQIRRRHTSPAGSPANLASGEMAWDDVGQTLYIGAGDDGTGQATQVVSIAGGGAVVLRSLLGSANGLVVTDANNKIPASYLPASATGTLTFISAWDASANSPALASSSGTKGNYYIVSKAGTTNLDGNSTWSVGDQAIFNGSVWQRVPAAGVQSVAGRTGAVVLASLDLTDVTSAGRAVLTAANTAAIRALLSLDSRSAVADANYAVLAADSNVQYSSITAARTVTLLAANSYNPGRRVRIGDESGACSTANTITVVTAGSDTLNGGANYTLQIGYGQVELQTDGTSKWTVVNQTAPSVISGGNF